MADFLLVFVADFRIARPFIALLLAFLAGVVFANVEVVNEDL